MNLGDKLKAIQARTASEANRQRIEREASENLKAKQDLESVQQFFRHAREAVEAAIMSIGEAPKPLVIGRSNTRYASLAGILKTYGQDLVSHPKHPYYFLWEEFATWARDNGLLAIVKPEHNGDGMEGWWELSVKPL